MDIREEIELQDCPFCGGPGILEEDGDCCWYAICADCGSQTATFDYKDADGRRAAAASAASFWNMGKVFRSGVGD